MDRGATLGAPVHKSGMKERCSHGMGCCSCAGHTRRSGCTDGFGGGASTAFIDCIWSLSSMASFSICSLSHVSVTAWNTSSGAKSGNRSSMAIDDLDEDLVVLRPLCRPSSPLSWPLP